MTIQLIVGLGNPGKDYEETRHNVGVWLVEQFANMHQTNFKVESKFQGLLATLELHGKTYRLLLPTTYMNHSGQAVSQAAHFYKIPAEQILVAHDDLDLPTGTARIKEGGGHGGHNGLRDIHNHMGPNYKRLRIGIAHPGQSKHVANYVLSKPGVDEKINIQLAIDAALKVMPDLLEGNIQKAMRELHIFETPNAKGTNHGI